MMKSTTLFALLLALNPMVAIAQPISASNVRYANNAGIRNSAGIKTSTVQQAIDALGSSVSKLMTGKLGKSVTWSGTATSVINNAIERTSVTVEFTATSNTTGSWTSTPFNIFSPTESIFGNETPFAGQGTWSGQYEIVGNNILASDLTNPNGTKLAAGRSSTATGNGASLELVDGSFPFSVTILHK